MISFTGTEKQFYTFLDTLPLDCSESLEISLLGIVKDIFAILDELECCELPYHLDLRKISGVMGPVLDVGYQPPFSFKNLQFINSLYLPDTIRRMYYNGIENCPSLKKIYLPENLIEISNKAIINCPKLVLFIPETLQNVSPKMFWNIKKVVFSKKSNFYIKEKSILSKDGKTYFGTLDVLSTNLIIPDGVEKAANYSFWKQEGEVHFPESLKEIAAPCFDNCSCKIVFENPMTVNFPRGGFPKELSVPQYEETRIKQEKMQKFKVRAVQVALDSRMAELERKLPRSSHYTVRLSNPLYSKETILVEVNFPKLYSDVVCRNRMDFYVPILEGFDEECERIIKILNKI